MDLTWIVDSLGQITVSLMFIITIIGALFVIAAMLCKPISWIRDKLCTNKEVK